MFTVLNAPYCRARGEVDDKWLLTNWVPFEELKNTSIRSLEAMSLLLAKESTIHACVSSYLSRLRAAVATGGPNTCGYQVSVFPMLFTLEEKAGLSVQGFCGSGCVQEPEDLLPFTEACSPEQLKLDSEIELDRDIAVTSLFKVVTVIQVLNRMRLDARPAYLPQEADQESFIQKRSIYVTDLTLVETLLVQTLYLNGFAGSLDVPVERVVPVYTPKGTRIYTAIGIAPLRTDEGYQGVSHDLGSISVPAPLFQYRATGVNFPPMRFLWSIFL
ncbi:hypothetical protein K3495_g10915 [Podosphaera aphanis]|nr:hypothetical protein K3495_g10915 [Podosphaera aphanis]